MDHLHQQRALALLPASLGTPACPLQAQTQFSPSYSLFPPRGPRAELKLKPNPIALFPRVLRPQPRPARVVSRRPRQRADPRVCEFDEPSVVSVALDKTPSFSES